MEKGYIIPENQDQYLPVEEQRLLEYKEPRPAVWTG